MNGMEIMTFKGVCGYVDAGGVAQLNLEDVARGLGFTKTETKNGTEYTTVRWERVFGFLDEIGFDHKWAKDGYIPENIFYRLAMKAKNAVAEAFQAKIADEVIPSIRKHGAYMTPDTIEKVLTDPDTIIRLATALKDEQKKRMMLEIKIEADIPKVLFADAVTASHNSILVGELAKLLKQNGVEIGQNRLFDWLRQNGYLIRRQGIDRNMPTQRAMEMGLFEIKETAISHSDGHTTISKTPKVTGKGQQYFVNIFLNN